MNPEQGDRGKDFPLQRVIASMPAMTAFRYEPKEKQLWERWVHSFLPLYAEGNDDEKYRACAAMRAKNVVGYHIPMMEMIWKFGEEQYADMLSGMLDTIIEQDRRWYPARYGDLLFFLKSSSAIPTEIKKRYLPEPEDKAFRKVIGRQSKRLFKDTVFERTLEKGNLPSDSSDGLTLLKRLHKRELVLPKNPSFTSQILEYYPQDAPHGKKIRKVLKKIHKRFSKWAEMQTEKFV